MKINIWSFDLDKTLLDKEENLSELDSSEIKKVSENDITLINTGRHYLRAIKYAKEIKAPYIISFNGTTIYSVEENKVVSSKHLPIESLKLAISQAEEENMLMGIYLDEGVLLLDYSSKQKQYIEYYKDLEIWKETNPTLHKKYNEKINVDDFINKYGNRVYKISYLFTKNFWLKERFNIMKRIEEKQGKNAKIYMGSLPDIEISVSNTSKFTGIQELIKLKNIEDYELISFGDGYNDIEILKNSSKAVVMDISSDEVKKYSTEIIKYESGEIGKVIKKYYKNNIR